MTEHGYLASSASGSNMGTWKWMDLYPTIANSGEAQSLYYGSAAMLETFVNANVNVYLVWKKYPLNSIDN